MLELKIPPAALVFAAASIILMIGRGLDVTWLQFSLFGLSDVLGALLCGLALLMCLTALNQFRRHRTTVLPHVPDKASRLLTGGLFHYSRNPIYLSFIIGLSGIALAMQNYLGLGVVALTAWFLQRYQILPEERALQRRFGPAFEHYCQRTRRWL